MNEIQNVDAEYMPMCTVVDRRLDGEDTVTTVLVDGEIEEFRINGYKRVQILAQLGVING